MKVYNNIGVPNKTLNVIKILHSVTCDKCSRVLTPKQNESYYELTVDKKEYHLCSTYCLNKKVAELSIDDTISGIKINKGIIQTSSLYEVIDRRTNEVVFRHSNKKVCDDWMFEMNSSEDFIFLFVQELKLL